MNIRNAPSIFDGLNESREILCASCGQPINRELWILLGCKSQENTAAISYCSEACCEKGRRMPFGHIRRGDRFEYLGEEWVRTKGTFAKRVSSLGMPGFEWPMNVKTLVKPLRAELVVKAPRRHKWEYYRVGNHPKGARGKRCLICGFSGKLHVLAKYGIPECDSRGK